MCRDRAAIERWIDISARAARDICAASLFVLAAVVSAVACPICFSGLVVTIGQQMDAADQVALAVPLPDGERLRVVAVVKGDLVVGATISEPVSRVKGTLAADAFVADPASRATAALPHGDKLILLMRNALGQRWSSVGAIDAEYAGWLRQLAATYRNDRPHSLPAWPRSTQTVSELTDDEWRERIALVAPYLENPEPLAADIAYGEISRAPYTVLRTLKQKLAATTVARWTDDPKLIARHPTYTLLLGIAGGPDQVPSLERRIDAAWTAHDATNLAAMLAADLELRGPSRVDSLEKRYFSDGNRTLPEIEAALLALSVQGGANGAIPRARVIMAYRAFIRERKAMAGFVASELADWEYWDATKDYVALLKSNAVKDPAAHFMIVNYLQRSPNPAAKAALRSLARERH
jgi:hypothetical protein